MSTQLEMQLVAVLLVAFLPGAASQCGLTFDDKDPCDQVSGSECVLIVRGSKEKKVSVEDNPNRI